MHDEVEAGCRRLRAIGFPMTPSPMKPIRFIPSPPVRPTAEPSKADGNVPTPLEAPSERTEPRRMSPSSARTTEPGWQEDRPRRLIRTNLRERDMEDIDAEGYVESSGNCTPRSR